MKDNYDFSQSVPNPYLKKLKQPITLQLQEDILDYFTQLAEETGISSQKLMTLYLQDCVKKQRKPKIEWLSKDNSL